MLTKFLDQRFSNGWVFSKKLDFAVFHLPVLMGVLLSWLLVRTTDFYSPDGYLWVLFFVLFMFGVDFPHTFSTIYRTFLDPVDRKKNLWVNVAVVAVCFAFCYSFTLATSGNTTWVIILYLTVFHFVRQQIGWVAWSNGKGTRLSKFDFNFDKYITYVVALFPMAIWHTGLIKMNWWPNTSFVSFIPQSLIPGLVTFTALSLLVYVVRQIFLFKNGVSLNLAKYSIILSTLVAWWGAILYFRDPTTQMLLIGFHHGVPYMYLVYRYNQSAKGKPETPLGSIMAFVRFYGLIVFLGFLFYQFDRSIWGADQLSQMVSVAPNSLANFDVPIVEALLMLPSLLHYVFDSFVWKFNSYNRGLKQLVSDLG